MSISSIFGAACFYSEIQNFVEKCNNIGKTLHTNKCSALSFILQD